MNITLAIVFLLVGLIVLWKSADVMVNGAVGLAKRFGISSLVIGLTVVAMGTSAPEVAASITAALQGDGDIAIGNVYGSNIANLALVGGMCALILPIATSKRLMIREIPVMLASALLLWPILADKQLTRPEGITMLSIFVFLIFVTITTARKEAANKTPSASDNNAGSKSKTLGKYVLLVVIGLIGLAVGAKMTVIGAKYLGQRVGLSQAVIGLTIVAIGTSLPELVTCVVAALKGHNDISIGNLVGSNIFNTLLVTGVAGAIQPFAIVPRLIGTDYWIMIAVSVGFVTIAIAGRSKIGKIGGTILLCTYFAFIVYLLICPNGM